MTPDAVPKATPAPRVAPPNPTSRVIPTPAPIAADSASSPQLQGRRFRMKVQSVREFGLLVALNSTVTSRAQDTSCISTSRPEFEARAYSLLPFDATNPNVLIGRVPN